LAPPRAVIEAVQDQLGPLAAEPVTLGGGITNHNFRARFGDTEVVLRIAGQLLRPETEPSSGVLVRDDNVNSVTVSCSEPVGLQVDGDYLGVRDGARFTSVPSALRVLTGVPSRLRDDNSDS